MNIFKKQGFVKGVVIVVALLLVVGLVGGVLAATKTSSDTTSTKTVISSSSSSSSGSIKTYTVSYTVGDYGVGSVPSSRVVTEGSNVLISFDPYPSISDGTERVFIGWTTSTSGQGVYTWQNTDYDLITSEDPYIYNIHSDIVLAPVFQFIGNESSGGEGGNQGGESSSSYGTLNVSVEGIANFGAYHDPDGYDRTDDCEILGTGSDSFSFGDGDYYLFIDYSTDSGAVVTFTGYYEGTYYDNVSISTYYGEDNTATGRHFIVDPYKGYSYWNFSEGDGGTLSIVKTGGGH